MLFAQLKNFSDAAVLLLDDHILHALLCIVYYGMQGQSQFLFQCGMEVHEFCCETKCEHLYQYSSIYDYHLLFTLVVGSSH